MTPAPFVLTHRARRALEAKLWKKDLYWDALFRFTQMNSEIKALKRALRNRKAELQRLIDQMKTDQLSSGGLYRNLEKELSDIRQKLDTDSSAPK